MLRAQVLHVPAPTRFVSRMVKNHHDTPITNSEKRTPPPTAIPMMAPVESPALSDVAPCRVGGAEEGVELGGSNS